MKDHRLSKYCLCMSVALLLVGCDRRANPINESRVAIRYGAVFEMKLADGTLCAVYDNYNGGGISCDWSKP